MSYIIACLKYFLRDNMYSNGTQNNSKSNYSNIKAKMLKIVEGLRATDYSLKGGVPISITALIIFVLGLGCHYNDWHSAFLKISRGSQIFYNFLPQNSS
jgi:hypothetical protein